MDAVLDVPVRTFVAASEVWVPEGDRLVLAGGDYGDLEGFAEASRHESFARGEGLPGLAWAKARPVVLKGFDGSYFKRTDAAREAGLTAAVAIPVFAGKVLKAVLVTLFSDGDERTGAVEVWSERDGLLMLDDGYYGAARHFEWVSQHTHFPRGQGLPGGVWASGVPMLLRDLGTGYRFVRADAAGKAGLTTGLGLPVAVPGDRTFVLTLLSARGTPIARRFEIWDARETAAGSKNEALLIDGICARDGALWPEDGKPWRRISAWAGPVGQVLGTGLPLAVSGGAGLPAGYEKVVALPVYRGTWPAFVVAWYC